MREKGSTRALQPKTIDLQGGELGLLFGQTAQGFCVIAQEGTGTAK